MMGMYVWFRLKVFICQVIFGFIEHLTGKELIIILEHFNELEAHMILSWRRLKCYIIDSLLLDTSLQKH